MCGGSKPAAPPAPKPDPTIAARGTDNAATASLGKRPAIDESKSGDTLGGNSASPGGPTASVLGG